jgi:hypothetical protein
LDRASFNQLFMKVNGTEELRFYADASVSSIACATNSLLFETGGIERARITSGGDFGIGESSPTSRLFVTSSTSNVATFNSTNTLGGGFRAQRSGSTTFVLTTVAAINGSGTDYSPCLFSETGLAMHFATGGSATTRMMIDSSGKLGVGQTPITSIDGTAGTTISPVGYMQIQRSAGHPIALNRTTDDGDLILFYQAGTQEGAISVNGTTVTYGGGHLARFGQLPDGSEDPTLLKGTVLTNLNEMCVWINKETGIPADNEQCNKVKISDVDGDANVAGVFVSWSYDEQHDTNDLFVAMTGDMIIRIAQGTTVARGDLLMSAGDGTAKPQGDDIVRSKTVAKVTSTHVTCTYADGSYCVPCVLMAC